MIIAADHQQRLVQEIDSEIVSWIGNLIHSAEAQPFVPKKILDFVIQKILLGVKAPG